MKKEFLFTIISLSSFLGFAQKNTVAIDLHTQKYIGSESLLNREKYFSMHASYIDNDLAADPQYLFENLGIEFGRTFGGPGPFAKYKKGDLSLENAKRLAAKTRKFYLNAPLYNKYSTEDLIITNHPRDAFKYKQNPEEAIAFNVEFIKHAYPKMPKYYEVMNEPFVHAKDFVETYKETDQVIIEMSKYHKLVADKVHNDIPNILVGGYSAAWPEYDKSNFKIWNTRMKVFMDIAGENMDFFATHIYDGRNVEGDFNFRSGSNSEAILDLIESYSFQKWGLVKPHLISEYGYTAKGLQGKPYSPELNAICLTSYNKILMSLLDKPDRLLKAIPFITGKANWFYKSAENPNGYPYPWVLIKKDANGNDEYTHLKKFWELWKNVEGKRIYATSTNPDIQVNGFINKTKAYVALNNLDDANQTVNLNFLNSSENSIKNLTIRRSYVSDSGQPKLVFFTNAEPLNHIELKKDETVILEYDIDETPIAKTSKESNYYTKQCLIPIKENTPIVLEFDNVVTTKTGHATLKMGLGRAHDLSKAPQVTINGKPIEVPNNWAGYDQAGREQFFGVIPIPSSIENIKKGKNIVKITFPDNGGFLSSLVLNVETFN